MANFTYNAAITERNYPEWEAWLDKITAVEAARVADPAGLIPGEVPTQGAYDELMQTAQHYYTKMR